MNAAEKRAAWRVTYHTPAPPGFSATLLEQAVAYHWQEKVEGGLRDIELQQLSAAAGIKLKARPSPIALTLTPGTWLSRTYHGEAHHVVVLDKGFEYRGQRFTSLTAISDRITGTHSSGPRFFGLLVGPKGKKGLPDGR